MKTKHSNYLAAAALAALSMLALAACNSTAVRDTWTAPDVSRISFKKIMVVATFPDMADRRNAEDALKAQITRADCVTSYSVLGDETDVKDIAKVSAVIKAAGVDGIVVMRPVLEKSEILYRPGMLYPGPYRMFRSYYSPYYALRPYYYQPGRYSVERTVEIETNIYEAAGGRLLWSAVTTSPNPTDPQQLMKDASAAIRAELVREGLISRP
jgi:hypothetical protein